MLDRLEYHVECVEICKPQYVVQHGQVLECQQYYIDVLLHNVIFDERSREEAYSLRIDVFLAALSKSLAVAVVVIKISDFAKFMLLPHPISFICLTETKCLLFQISWL